MDVYCKVDANVEIRLVESIYIKKDYKNLFALKGFIMFLIHFLDEISKHAFVSLFTKFLFSITVFFRQWHHEIVTFLSLPKHKI